MNNPTTDTPREKLPADHLGILIASLLMMGGGWYGLFVLVTQTIPRVGQRWLFFVLMHIAITGTMIPLVRYVNTRLTPIDRPLPPAGVIVRQSVWLGLFAVTCAWLQILDVLSWSVAFFLSIVLIVTEFFIRMRERQIEREFGP